MIDFAVLERLVTANKEAKDFSLAGWVRHQPCGTYGCLVGNFCLAYPEDELRIPSVLAALPRTRRKIGFDAVAERFGITRRELANAVNGGVTVSAPTHLSTNRFVHRKEKERLIAYKKRKATIFADLERARHQEGNWMVTRHVAEELAQREVGVLAK